MFTIGSLWDWKCFLLFLSSQMYFNPEMVFDSFQIPFRHMLKWSYFPLFYIKSCALTDFFCLLNQPYNLVINPTWWWCNLYFTYCWIQFVNIFLSIVMFKFIRGIGWPAFHSFFFPCDVIVWFLSQGDTSLIEGAGDYACFFFFLMFGKMRPCTLRFLFIIVFKSLISYLY